MKLSLTIFMKHKTPGHYTSITRDYHYRIFSTERVISCGCDIPWSLLFPDLNPLNYWFWSTLMAQVFHNDASKDLISLKGRIYEVYSEITIDEIAVGIFHLIQRM